MLNDDLFSFEVSETIAIVVIAHGMLALDPKAVWNTASGTTYSGDTRLCRFMIATTSTISLAR